MPISQINPDGTVRIYNTKTGETKDVASSDLASYNPALVGDYQKKLQEQQTISGAATNIQTYGGDIPMATDATSVAVANKLRESGYTPATAAEKKVELAKAQAKPKVESLVTAMENLKSRAKDVTMTDSILSKVTGGNLGTDAATFEQSKKLIAQYLAKLVENNRLSDADRQFYQKEIANISAVGFQGSIEKKIDNLKQELITLAGYNPEEFGQKKNEVTPQEPSGNILDNAKKDVNNLIQGATQLPRIAGEIAQDPKVIQGVASGQMPMVMTGIGQNKQVQDMLKGTAQEYGELAKDPIGHAIEHPVNTALDVMPLVGGAKSVVGGTKNAVSKVSGATKSSTVLPDIGVNAFSSNFTIPSKLAPRIKIDEVAKTMIEHGHSGDLNKLAEVTQKVTGQNGIFPKLNRDALALVKEPIPFDGAITTGGKLLDDIPELSTKQVAGHKKIIRDIIKPGDELGKSDAFSTFDAIQELEKRGYQYKNSSTKLTPNLVNEKIGDAYIQAADELKTLIDNNQSANNIVDALKTPENIVAIQQISPKLAEEFMAAKSMRDLRKIQSPYVRLKQAIDLTQDASRTPFSQMSNKVAASIGAGGGAILGSVVPGVGTLAGGVLGGMAGPFIAPIIERAMPAVTTKAAQVLNRGQQLPPIK